MFWRPTPQTDPRHPRNARRKVARAVGLARAFLLLEEEFSPPELPGEPPPHPHRSPLVVVRRPRRPGAGVPRAQPCLSPVEGAPRGTGSSSRRRRDAHGRGRCRV